MRPPTGVRVLVLACMLGTLAASAIPAQALAFEIVRPQDASREHRPRIEVAASSDVGLDIVFDLPALAIEDLTVGTLRYQSVAIPGGGLDGEIGHPALPFITRLVAIPADAGVSVSVEREDETVVPGVLVAPMQADEGTDFAFDESAYARMGVMPSIAARAGDPARLREMRVIPLTFRPVRYDAGRRELLVSRRLRVHISFDGEDARNPGVTPRAIPPSFDRLYRELVVNYEAPPAGVAVQRGTWLLITPDNTAVTSRLQPLVDWRKSKGQFPRMVTTAETGTMAESIKSYIQNAYDTWDPPLEYVVLAGDATGSYPLPTWFENLSGQVGEGDHPYTLLAGDDILSDVHVGRLSFSSTTELEAIVNKITGYEKTPYVTDDPGWFSRACLTGDPYDSGYSTVQVQQWIKERLLQIGYAQVDTIFDQPFVPQMLAALNRGDTVFSYRGIYGMSGWTNANTYQLTNSWKMPFVVTITCGTGSFAYETSRSEGFLRANAGVSAPRGGIAAIGTATIGTHTRQNNCIHVGIFYGLLYEGAYDLGAALTRGKYELYLNFQETEPNFVTIWSYWNNLMGDPALECWTGFPHPLTVEHPATVPIGSNAVAVTVRDQNGDPCADAQVCLWKGTETYAVGGTDAEGRIELPVSVPTVGSMLLTVTQHDRRAFQATIPVSGSNVNVGCAASAIDDDASGTSSGNGDGIANPGESIELRVQLRNYGIQTAPGVTATLTSEDPYVTITDAEEAFGNIAAGASVWSGDDFDLTISPACPHGRPLRLHLDIRSGANAWHSLIDLTVVSADLVAGGFTLYNVGGNQILDPGESGQISVILRNDGGAVATGTTATLLSRSAYVTVTDGSAVYGTINAGGVAENTGDRFAVSAAADVYGGHLAEFSLITEFSEGRRDTTSFRLTVGTRSSTDPTGPDRHGYLAFDDTDVSYQDAPTYQWIEIDPVHGGGGTPIPLTDYGTYQDDSKVIDLPFPFVYYGETYHEATVCSNGWIAMGSTYLTDYRNWSIPAGNGPQAMIAGFWDDLRLIGAGGVFRWYDAPNHRLVIEWSRTQNEMGGQQTFEVILYDPAYHPTTTGDGIIEMQYHTVNDNDYSDNYGTAGIENAMQDDGVLYSYYHESAPGAAPLQAGRAVRYVAFLDLPSGILQGIVTNASNGGSPIAGAEVRIAETGRSLVTGEDGRFAGTTPVGVYTVFASAGGFAPDTLAQVEVTLGAPTEIAFALTDIAGPAITGVSDPGSTTDAVGPYPILAGIADASGVVGARVYYRLGGMGGWIPVDMAGAQGTFTGLLPGRPSGTRIDFYVWAQDGAGFTSVFPPDAPASYRTFYVTELAYDYTVEDPEDPTWQLGVDGDGAHSGVWERADPNGNAYNGSVMQPEDDHTPDPGVLCFVTGQGSPGGGPGEEDVDGGCTTLVSPSFDLADATHAFVSYHRFYGEGGNSVDDEFAVDASSDGGQTWVAIERVASIENAWKRISLDLASVITLTADVRLRFVACDLNTAGIVEACVDDVAVEIFRPNLVGVEDLLIPARPALGQNEPNPARDATRIRFGLPAPGVVSIAIFDAAGRKIRTLAGGVHPAGYHETTWDGRDDAGHPVVSGVYFYRLEGRGGTTPSRRMTIVR